MANRDTRVGLRKALAVGVAAVASLACAAPAAASPVATNDEQYQALGRVFPDPLAACSQAGAEPCSPNAQGNVPATQFIQIQEFLDALQYMNQRDDWSRYMEVLVLDGALGANGPGQGPADGELGVGSPGGSMFPGNDLPLEFDPKPEYRSAGLPTSTLDRNRSDLITVRVTDESVPDAGKERYALSLSIHGIERAGVEGGTRAAEDLITAATTGRSDQPIVSENVRTGAPGFARVLRESIIYFTYPNPDGWRRGSVSEGGLFFQRYNGNGVDLNRDWPDIGFTFRPYSGLSEPESRALSATLTQIQQSTGSGFAAGDDLHGQPLADALSYTLLPHGSHDFAKNERIRDTSIAIHRASEEALLWSPIVQENSAPQGGGAPCVPGTPVGTGCAQIYGQTWGTVYDTINYTTTGALGDWFDSSIGLGADGIDNEMSFSHLDKNIVFDPHTEQLHVDGNKALIYAHLATILDPVSGRFDVRGTKGFVAGTRLSREEKSFQSGPPEGTTPQADIDSGPQPPGPDGNVVFPFEVQNGPQPGGANVFNGGMRVDITETNVGGVGGGNLINGLKIQCRGCDEHVGVTEDDEWVTVTEDFNQSPVYLQSGLTAAVNRPQAIKADGSPVEWRALVEGPTALARMQIDFTSGPATSDGGTAGDDPPRLAGYNVANTDFFDDLDPVHPRPEPGLRPGRPARRDRGAPWARPPRLARARRRCAARLHRPLRWRWRRHARRRADPGLDLRGHGQRAGSRQPRAGDVRGSPVHDQAQRGQREGDRADRMGARRERLRHVPLQGRVERRRDPGRGIGVGTGIDELRADRAREPGPGRLHRPGRQLGFGRPALQRHDQVRPCAARRRRRSTPAPTPSPRRTSG